MTLHKTSVISKTLQMNFGTKKGHCSLCGSFLSTKLKDSPSLHCVGKDQTFLKVCLLLILLYFKYQVEQLSWYLLIPQEPQAFWLVCCWSRFIRLHQARKRHATILQSQKSILPGIHLFHRKRRNVLGYSPFVSVSLLTRSSIWCKQKLREKYLA